MCIVSASFYTIDRDCVTDQSDVTVVPSVVVNQCGAVSHAGDLVAIVPPTHHPGVTRCVVRQPVVRLPEIIQDLPRPATHEYSLLYKFLIIADPV